MKMHLYRLQFIINGRVQVVLLIVFKCFSHFKVIHTYIFIVDIMTMTCYILILGGGSTPPLSRLDSLVVDILGSSNVVKGACHDRPDDIHVFESPASSPVTSSHKDERYELLHHTRLYCWCSFLGYLFCLLTYWEINYPCVYSTRQTLWYSSVSVGDSLIKFGRERDWSISGLPEFACHIVSTFILVLS